MTEFFGIDAMKKLAKKGNAGAQNYVGMAYDLGSGVGQDYAEAVKWYRLAAKQGHVDAQLRLGKMYGEGIGVKQDFTEAVKWYRLAVEQGHPEALEAIRAMGHSE